MKRTSLLAILVTLATLTFPAADASAYYHAELGRFINRDPVAYDGGDPNTYRYVHNEPTDAVDPFGLWKSGEHKQQTKDALIKGMPLSGTTCVFAILPNLQAANVGQDAGSAPFGPGSDPGEQFYRHYCAEEGQTKTAVDGAYLGYLASELQLFAAELASASPTRSNCDSALEALGRATHSWQDYYAHAVKVAPGNKTTPLKDTTWGNPYILTGNPDAPGPDVKAPSFYYPSGGKHGWREPASRDSPTGEALRKTESIEFVAGKYKKYMPQWLQACRCHYCP